MRAMAWHVVDVDVSGVPVFALIWLPESPVFLRSVWMSSMNNLGS